MTARVQSNQMYASNCRQEESPLTHEAARERFCRDVEGAIPGDLRKLLLPELEPYNLQAIEAGQAQFASLTLFLITSLPLLEAEGFTPFLLLRGLQGVGAEGDTSNSRATLREVFDGLATGAIAFYAAVSPFDFEQTLGFSQAQFGAQSLSLTGAYLARALILISRMVPLGQASGPPAALRRSLRAGGRAADAGPGGWRVASMPPPCWRRCW